jgi:acyl dehydratase
MTQADTLAMLQGKVGEVLYVSDWLTVGQDRINAFADATLDHQWIHVDEARAAKESPYGAPIAHGFLTLSLYPYLRNLVNEEQPIFPGVKNVINYGLNKVRFPNAVRVGSRVRGHFKLAAVEEIRGGLQITEVYTAEVEGADKPACVAEAIMRLYF